MKSNHFEFGYLMAAAAQGVGPLGAYAAQGAGDTTEDRTALDMGLIKLAAEVFQTVDPASPEACVFRRAAAGQWTPGCTRLAEHVSTAHGRVKMATSLLPVLAATHDKLGGKLLRTLVAAGVLGGAGVGSLGFLLSRNSRQSSADNEVMLEKVRTYRQLAGEIKEDMQMNAALAPKPKERRYDV